MDHNFNIDNKHASNMQDASKLSSDDQVGKAADTAGKGAGEGETRKRPLIVNILASFIAIGLALQLPNCMGM